jgi:hypothetical protein
MLPVTPASVTRTVIGAAGVRRMTPAAMRRRVRADLRARGAR